jgi:DNA repair protein RecO (recombination protein O)
VPTLTDNAICLRRWDFSETSQTVSLLTESHGLLRGLAKGAKRSDGRFSGGFDLLTRGQITLILKPGRDLVILTEWHLAEVFWAARKELAANRASLYMVDLAHRMLKEQDPHPEVYLALASALAACHQPDRIGIETLIYQWRLLVACGYRPRLDHAAETDQSQLCEDRLAQVVLFSPLNGGVVGANPAGDPAGDAVRVRTGTIDLLQAVSEGDFVAAAAQPEGVRRANRLLAVCFRALLGEAPPAMRWAFADLNATTASSR